MNDLHALLRLADTQLMQAKLACSLQEHTQARAQLAECIETMRITQDALALLDLYAEVK